MGGGFCSLFRVSNQYVKNFLPPQDDEIRAWGSNARFKFDQNGAKIHIIYGDYNSMAARVFNDIHQKYSGYGRPFQLGNKLNLHVIDALNGDIKQALDNDSVIKLNENRVEILITKLGGRLQPLLVYRVRVHASLMELKDSTMSLLKSGIGIGRV